MNRFRVINNYNKKLMKMMKVCDTIKLELEVASARQKYNATRPSGYMKGLQKALDIIEDAMREDNNYDHHNFRSSMHR